MRLNWLLLLLSCSVGVAAIAQNDSLPLLNIGSPAPPLQVGEWLKGKPVVQFEKGKVYVLDFWATWCKPCTEGMPNLSVLARKYNKQVKVLGIDIKEKKTTTPQKLQRFVDSMSRRMNFHVATDDGNFMMQKWYEASRDAGIPKCFVVDKNGRIAWIGHTTKLGAVLPQIINDTWDINLALAERNQNIRLEQLDHEANYLLNNYEGKSSENFYGDPDSALLVINEMVKKEPQLKFASSIAYHTFSALLKTNPDSAYKYGVQALFSTTGDDPPYYAIITNIDAIAGWFASPPKIYWLGAETYQAEIDRYPWYYSTPKIYLKMAEWYIKANEKSKAQRSLKKATKLVKKSKNLNYF